MTDSNQQSRHEFTKIASRRLPSGNNVYQVTCNCGWLSDWNSDPRHSIDGHRRRLRKKAA